MAITLVFLAALALTVMGALGLLSMSAASVLGLGLTLQIKQDTWRGAGILFDSFDLTLALVVVALAVRGMPRNWVKRIPRLGLWLVLAAFLAASYSVSPSGEQNMTDPIRSVYQIYRYGIRFVILYPLACIVLDTPRAFDQLVTGLLVAVDVFSLMAIRQGYTGAMAIGPFATKNVLGGVLAVPVVLVFVDVVRGRPSLFTLVSGVLLARAILFAASRGAFAGILAGSGIAWWFMYRGRIRTRVVALVLAAVAAFILLITVKPDLLQRPTIAQFFTTFDPGQQTLSWRIHERWPHFIHRALQKPWLGWGTDRDESLGPRTNTAHNGYLALANTFGFPVMGFYVLFALIGLRDAWKGSRGAQDPADRVRAAKIGGGIVCLLMHNVVDSVVMLNIAGGELWIFAAVAAGLVARTVRARARRRPAPSGQPVLALGARS
jgi:hypothetical protein